MRFLMVEKDPFGVVTITKIRPLSVEDTELLKLTVHTNKTLETNCLTCVTNV